MKNNIPPIDWFVALGHANTTMHTVAVEALGKDGLLVALQHPEWTTRQAAAEELAAFLLMHDVQQALITALFKDEDSLVRATVVSVLAHLGQQTPVDILVTALQREKNDWEVREMILSVFADLADLAPVEPIIASLQDDEALVRAVAVRALGNYHTSASLTALVSALYDPSPIVQEQAATILWHGREQAQGALLQACSEDPDDPITSLVYRLRNQQQGHTQQFIEQINAFLHIPASSYSDSEDAPANSLEQPYKQQFSADSSTQHDSDTINWQKQSSMRRQIDSNHASEARQHDREGETIMSDTDQPINPPTHITCYYVPTHRILPKKGRSCPYN